jgi:hypothetical protein
VFRNVGTYTSYPDYHSKERIQHSEHGEILISEIYFWFLRLLGYGGAAREHYCGPTYEVTWLAAAAAVVVVVVVVVILIVVVVVCCRYCCCNLQFLGFMYFQII